jgi:hypothetical protein
LNSDSQQLEGSPLTFNFNLASRLIKLEGLESCLDSTIDVDGTKAMITRATRTKAL